MKYLKEIAIIFGITMIGELLNQWIPVPGARRSLRPVHPSWAFMLRAVKLRTSRPPAICCWILMPLMFIPSAVGLIEKFDELKAILLPFLSSPWFPRWSS